MSCKEFGGVVMQRTKVPKAQQAPGEPTRTSTCRAVCAVCNRLGTEAPYAAAARHAARKAGWYVIKHQTYVIGLPSNRWSVVCPDCPAPAVKNAVPKPRKRTR